MSRQELENALYDIGSLLSYEIHREPIGEDEYQKWFDEYRIVFDLLGYKNVIPHPRLEPEYQTKEILIPDFLVQGIDDIWAIFEIKRPDTEILKRNTRRQDFYSSFNSYISQCLDYSEFFDDKANREAFNSKYNITVFKDPRCILVSGRNEGLDKSVIQKLIVGRRNAIIDLKTYDDIINTIEYHRAKRYGQYDDIEGFTAGGIFSVSKLQGKNNFIVDIGMNWRKNRISIYINKHDRLCLRVLDNNGKEYTTKMKIGSSYLCYDELFAMCFEVGIAKSSTIICLEINCEHFKDIYIDNIKFDPKFIFSISKENPYVNILWGTDISFKERSDLEFGEFFFYKNKLSYKLRNELRDYLFGRMQEEIETSIFGTKSNQFGSTSTNLISPRRQANSDFSGIVNLPYGIESLPPALFEYWPKTTGLKRKFKS